MPLEWKGQQARLFPITGIGGQGEEERRGPLYSWLFSDPWTSSDEPSPQNWALPKGTMETFIECTLPLTTARNSLSTRWQMIDGPRRRPCLGPASLK